MKIDYIKLAELHAGEKPYKGYYVPLEKGYVRLMSSRLDRVGMVVAVNYYGRVTPDGRFIELNRVTDKRQSVEEFEHDLADFRTMLEESGIEMVVEELWA